MSRISGSNDSFTYTFTSGGSWHILQWLFEFNIYLNDHVPRSFLCGSIDLDVITECRRPLQYDNHIRRGEQAIDAATPWKVSTLDISYCDLTYLVKLRCSWSSSVGLNNPGLVPLPHEFSCLSSHTAGESGRPHYWKDYHAQVIAVAMLRTMGGGSLLLR
jgi:hypothetical protein